jgi:hypothetical protein
MSIVDPQFSGTVSQDVICFGPFRLSTAERLLEKNGVRVRLGSQALDILIALVERPAEVACKKELIAKVWPDLVVDQGAPSLSCLGVAQGAWARPIGRTLCDQRVGPRLLFCRADFACRKTACALERLPRTFTRRAAPKSEENGGRRRNGSTYLGRADRAALFDNRRTGRDRQNHGSQRGQPRNARRLRRRSPLRRLWTTVNSVLCRQYGRLDRGPARQYR